MNLVPFSTQHLRLRESLPFGLRDGGGRMLLSAGVAVANEDVLARLQASDLFADETESAAWLRRLGSAMDTMMRQGASLKQIADVRPLAEKPRADGASQSLVAQWTEIESSLDSVLREVRADTPWQPRLAQLRERAGRLADRRPDAALYWMVYGAGHNTERYCSRHSLFCWLLVRDAGRALGLDAALLASLELASLSMNVAMRRLQDQLASSDLRVAAETRALIDAHPAQGAELLQAAGVVDAAWLQIVQQHHDSGQHPANPVSAAAALLRRVDIYTAKLSCRHKRAPMSSLQAAREARLGPDGQPDAIGAALLKGLGLYPPGSLLGLASGEIGIVVARGPRFDQPLMAVLINASGEPVGHPALRDTSQPRHAIKGPVDVRSVRLIPKHEVLMAMR